MAFSTKSNKMNIQTIEPDLWWIKAGECRQFLSWVQSQIVDFIVLEGMDNHEREQYNEPGNHPTCFSQKRGEWIEKSFSCIMKKFFEIWPKYENEKEIHEAIERVCIFRNAFSHAQVQPFRGYDLYYPNNWNKINQFCYCGLCFKYFGECNCNRKDISDPPCLKLDEKLVVDTVYLDIKRIDQECFYPISLELGVKYSGVAWPEK